MTSFFQQAFFIVFASLFLFSSFVLGVSIHSRPTLLQCLSIPVPLTFPLPLLLLPHPSPRPPKKKGGRGKGGPSFLIFWYRSHWRLQYTAVHSFSACFIFRLESSYVLHQVILLRHNIPCSAFPYLHGIIVENKSLILNRCDVG